MAYPPYRGGGGGPPMGYGHPPHGPPHGPGYYPPGPGGYMPHPAYDDGGPPPHGMRGPPGGFGRGYPPRTGPGHPSQRSGGSGSGKDHTTSASDTEGGSVSGFDSSSEAPKASNKPRGKSPYANDCEIVVLNKAQQKYAEMVERQLRESGLHVDLMFPKADIKIIEFLKPIAKLGAIFAVVIDQDCERGGNIHFYQFRGVPKAQYHKNVPLAQAYGLIKRIYNELKQKEVGAIPDPINGFLSKLQQEQYLDDGEYSALIRFLQERRKRQTSFLCRTSNIVPDHKNDVNSLLDSQEGKELQKRILSLLDENPSDHSSK